MQSETILSNASNPGDAANREQGSDPLHEYLLSTLWLRVTLHRARGR